MSRVLFFSLTAMLNPTLLAATTVMLLLAQPKKLMLGYLLGALLTSITLGLVIVFALENSDAVNTAKKTVNPAVDLAVGALLLVIAFVLARGRPRRVVARRRSHAKEDKGPPRWQRALGTGSPRITFVVGALLTLPGASYLAALTALNKLGYATAETVLLIIVVNVIMLALLEIPLIAFAVAPEWTPTAVQRAKAWFARNAHRAAAIGAGGVGSLLIVRGLVTALT
jgi:Sap, sulfolipid-1-addressing protein